MKYGSEKFHITNICSSLHNFLNFKTILIVEELKFILIFHIHIQIKQIIKNNTTNILQISCNL